jgi:hypothetical protein
MKKIVNFFARIYVGIVLLPVRRNVEVRGWTLELLDPDYGKNQRELQKFRDDTRYIPRAQERRGPIWCFEDGGDVRYSLGDPA